MAAHLVVSLAGITDSTLRACTELAAELDDRGVPLSLLVRPRPAAADGIRPGGQALRWVHERRAAGDAVVLYGFDHGLVPTGSWRLGRRAEFAMLPRHEASLRLTGAIRALAGLGLASDVFVPPRWLASPGTLAALRDGGFRVCADEVGVRLLASGEVLRGRVLAVGAQDAAAAWRCQALVTGAARVVRRGGLARLAVHGTELTRADARQAITAAVDTALRLGASAETYRTGTAAVGRAA